MRRWSLTVTAAALLLSCATGPSERPDEGARGLAGRPPFPARASTWASRGFWDRWGDGRAEMSGYRGVVSRYGELRPAELVLIFVTEPHDRETLIKDDDAPRERRVPMLKLNESLKFVTGVYPYSVMTSVFAPVDGYFAERFAPAKITLSAQEWCGHVFHGIWPGRDRFFAHGLSYFASEGEGSGDTETPEGTLYEDGLLIQLRELDGPFLGGRAEWEGPMLPTLWRNRRAHQPLRVEHTRITRADAEREGVAVTRFTIRQGDYQRVIDVERAEPRRILGWTTSEGERFDILRTARLPYWELNQNGEESHRRDLGFDPDPVPDANGP